MVHTTNKKIRVEFYLHKDAEEAKNQLLQIYCLVTFNRRTTRFPVRGVINFTSKILTKIDFQNYSFQRHEEEIRRIILHEISIVGEERFSVKGLSNRVQFYLNPVLHSVYTELVWRRNHYFGNNLSYFDYIKYEELEEYLFPTYQELLYESFWHFVEILCPLYIIIKELKKEITDIFDNETIHFYALGIRFFEYELLNNDKNNLVTNFDWFFGNKQKSFASFLNQNKLIKFNQFKISEYEMYEPIQKSLPYKSKKNDILLITDWILVNLRDDLKPFVKNDV